MDDTDRMEQVLQAPARQTSALETIRGILLFFVAATSVGVLAFIAAYASS